MSILSQTGKIILVRQPVNGRFGIHRLMAMLSSNQFGVFWNGTDEITIVTFNAKRTICKLLKYEISYFKSLHAVLLLLKVTTVISSMPFQEIFKELEVSIAISL